MNRQLTSLILLVFLLLVLAFGVSAWERGHRPDSTAPGGPCRCSTRCPCAGKPGEAGGCRCGPAFRCNLHCDCWRKP